ncbi:MAG: lysostaphin resistance A-like protein [Candidatus Acidiferrales bacterium]
MSVPPQDPLPALSENAEGELLPAVPAPPAPENLVPEDLRVPWSWGDLFLLLPVAFVAYLVLSIVMFAVSYFAFGITPSDFQRSKSLFSLFAVVAQVFLSVAILFYLFIVIRLRCGVPFWKTIGWRNLEPFHISRRLTYPALVFGGAFLAVLIQFASAPFEKKVKLPIEQYFQDPHSALMLMLMGLLIAPLFEETIFRGYIYPVIARRFGIGSGIFVTGTLFGLMHAVQLWGGWMQIFLLIVVGIVFTYARAAFRSVLASYLLHVSYNGFLFAAFLVATHGLRHFPAPN